jgi:hypothetical protein
MSPVNSRAKGKRAELALAQILSPYWPDVCRNLDQFTKDKRDLLNCAGVHWQVKHVESLNIWRALDQAITEAASTDIPVVAFKRNRSPWFAALELDELIPLLRLKEQG